MVCGKIIKEDCRLYIKVWYYDHFYYNNRVPLCHLQNMVTLGRISEVEILRRGLPFSCSEGGLGSFPKKAACFSQKAQWGN